MRKTKAINSFFWLKKEFCCILRVKEAIFVLGSIKLSKFLLPLITFWGKL